MRKKGMEDPKPRQKWCNDMLSVIKEWRKYGEILLLTDANSALTEKVFSNFVTQAETYRLTRTIVQGGVLPFHQFITSDHQTMFMDLNKHQLFR
eukprot:13580538-Ditylum_brightwellii.AAC.1